MKGSPFSDVCPVDIDLWVVLQERSLQTHDHQMPHAIISFPQSDIQKKVERRKGRKIIDKTS